MHFFHHVLICWNNVKDNTMEEMCMSEDKKAKLSSYYG